MILAQHNRRLWILTSSLLAGFGLIIYQLYDLMIVRGDEMLKRSESVLERVDIIPAMRGQIRDIRGNILALSVPVKTVCADPSLIGNYYTQVAKIVSPILQLDEAEVAKKLMPQVRLNDSGEIVTNKYVVLKRKVPLDVYEQLKGTLYTAFKPLVDNKQLPLSQRNFFKALTNSAIFADPIEDQLRVYPNGRLAAHILGYVGMNNVVVNGKLINETIGVDGVEKTLDLQLKGVHGWRHTERDRRNRELVKFRWQDVEPKDGDNVVLTIDAELQHILEAELYEGFKKQRPISACGIIVRPRTGEILAMAIYPNFDPNAPGNSPDDFRRNRMIADVHEPGSTFKVVVVSGALNERKLRLTDMINCSGGVFEYCGRVIRDHGKGHQALSVEEILEVSSNIGAAKIGMCLGEADLMEYIKRFGFGQKTGISLPGEVSGIVHPLKEWHKTSILSIPMGHEIAVTPIQTVMAVCAIANNGVLMRPMLIDRIEDKNGNVVVKYQPQAVRQVIAPEVSAQMRSALRRVTASKRGTAQRAALEYYTVAGKTGTAEKPGPGGYQHDKNFSTFIGFFPSESPELCIGIFMDEPKEGHLGGVVCAPVFKAVAERAASYLNIKPDILEPGTTPDKSNGKPRSPGEKMATTITRERYF